MRPFSTRRNTLKQATRFGLDRLALILSGLCLLHCLAIPAAFLFTPLVSSWLLQSETTSHWVLLILAIPTSAVALWRGYKSHHDGTILWSGGIGLILMFIGVSHIWDHVSSYAETLFTMTGVIALLYAHVRNLLKRHNLQHEI